MRHVDDAGMAMMQRVGTPRLLTLAVALVLILGGWALYRYGGGHIAIESAPAGAVVRINGRAIGRTPLTDRFKPGKYLLELELAPFESYRESFVLDRGERVSRHIELTAGVGTLKLLSNPAGAWVEVDGTRLQAVTPTVVEVVAGVRSIRMGLSERVPTEKKVMLRSGETLEVNLSPGMDPHAPLTVLVSPPDASVSFPELDGVSYKSGVRVPIGEQLIRVSRKGYSPQEIRFNVRFVTDNVTRVTLKRARGSVTVATRPAADVSIAYDDDGRSKRVPYQPGMKIPVGAIEVFARAMGYRTGYRRLNLTSEGRSISMQLSRIAVRPGEEITDALRVGGSGPRMVVIPAGAFTLGDDDGPPSVRSARRLQVTQPFAMSVNEVSIDEFSRFMAVGDLDKRLQSALGNEPVRFVSWHQANDYAAWLSEQTGAKYRLPTEAEWEYAARGGTRTRYSFGNDAGDVCAHANLADRSAKKLYSGWQVVDCNDGFGKLAPVGSFPANPFGLRDMHGNVSEWVLDCGVPSYRSSTADPTVPNQTQSCANHGHRGGSWDGQPAELEVTYRRASRGPGDDRGIRLLREL